MPNGFGGYIDGLADAVARAGGQIFEQSRVRDPSTGACITMEGHKVVPPSSTASIKAALFGETAYELADLSSGAATGEPVPALAFPINLVSLASSTET